MAYRPTQPLGVREMEKQDRETAEKSRPNLVCSEVPVTARIYPSKLPSSDTTSADPLSEKTNAIVVLHTGAVLRLSTDVAVGQVIVLANANGREIATRVISADKKGHVAVEFAGPADSSFWALHRNASQARNVSYPAAPATALADAARSTEILPPVLAVESLGTQTTSAQIGDLPDIASHSSGHRTKIFLAISAAAIVLMSLIAGVLFRRHGSTRLSGKPALRTIERSSPEHNSLSNSGVPTQTPRSEQVPNFQTLTADHSSVRVPESTESTLANSTGPSTARTFSPVPRSREIPVVVAGDLKPPSDLLNDTEMGKLALPSPLTEGEKVEALELPTELPKTGLSSAMSPFPALIKPGNVPYASFVLDRAIKAHSGWVTGVVFSSDGQRLASGSWDETVKLWNVPTGEELSTVGNKMKEVQALAFSRDGHWMAAENSRYAVTLWDAVTGREVRTLPGNKAPGVLGRSWVYSIAFSPDGRLLASGIDDKTVRLWDIGSGRTIRDLTALRRRVIYAAFSPDGRWLVSGDDDNNILIWDVATGEKILRLTGHKKLIYAAAFSPDGHRLASASADKTIRLWDPVTGRELHTLTGHKGLVTSLSFSPDGRWLASGSWDKTIRIWNVETGNQVQTLSGGNNSIYTVTFDSTGQRLASGDEDGIIRLWRLNKAVDQNGLR